MLVQLRSHTTCGFGLERGGITWKLAEAYGFCWGVERALVQVFEPVVDET